LRRERIHKILGPKVICNENLDLNTQITKRNLSDSEITDKLNLLGCSLVNKEYGWDVEVIPNRSQDLFREIDLIEEIARLIGYDMFDQNLPSPIKPGKLSTSQTALKKLKTGFVDTGFNEVLTYSLVPESNNDLIKISNPLLLETSCLRDNIWQEHIKICNQNIKSGYDFCWIFEVGNIFHNKLNFMQEEILNGAIYGNNKFEKWIDSSNQDLNYYEARGKLKEALTVLNLKIEDKPTHSIDFLHPGKSSLLFTEGNEVGYFGEIHPKLISEKKVLKKIYLFSLKIDNILKASTRKNKWIPVFKEFPIVPKMERDINFIFNKKYLVSDIFSHIKKTGKKLLEDVNLIDVYEDDDDFGNEFISYTFRLSYRDKVKTLLDSDIADIHEKIIETIENIYSTKLR